MSRTIINLYLSLVNSILHKEMVYINMPGIYCTGSPPIICNTYDALIVLENNILFNIISLCLHKHNRSYIESIKLTS